MEFFVIFLITMVISFAGSLQPGPLNITVLHRTTNQGYKSGIWVTAGGIFPELIYAAAAIGTTSILMKYNEILSVILWISVFVLFVTGIMLLKEKNPNVPHPVKNSRLFLEGFFAGISNPQLFIFWASINALLVKLNVLNNTDKFHSAGFILGAAAGALLLQVVIMLLANNNRFIFQSEWKTQINKLTGIVFIIFAVVAAIRIL